jgi:hypothetical protein
VGCRDRELREQRRRGGRRLHWPGCGHIRR